MRGDDHHTQPWRGRTDQRQQFQRRGVAKVQIKQADIEYPAADQRHRLFAAGGRGHRMAFVFQAVAEGLQQRRFVIDDQNPAARFFSSQGGRAPCVSVRRSDSGFRASFRRRQSHCILPDAHEPIVQLAGRMYRSYFVRH